MDNIFSSKISKFFEGNMISHELFFYYHIKKNINGLELYFYVYDFNCIPFMYIVRDNSPAAT